MLKGIVYTAQFGNWEGKADFLIEPKMADWRYIIFTDQERIKEEIQAPWEVQIVESFSLLEGGLIRSSRFYKALPHLVLPKTPVSFWLDYKCPKVSDKPQLTLDGMTKELGLLRHSGDVNNEFHAVWVGGKYTEKRIFDEQRDFYIRQEFPLTTPTVACTTILRRHTPQVEKFNNAWWEQQCRFTYRDQLSVNYVLWKLKMEPALISSSEIVCGGGF